ncbi:TerC family protein [Pseudomarimonas arenosa]|uniref:TerC family protein n=1 Tax=Pseudomarimonas arenosa TaxID=2774145 RepID=A0AAW3ZI30_9GAMM|nr:TerC family protein [Pseudomarimonas arenosa]MBD8525738.1 TerC family protein [Pseudomarimonas arenosa]
MHSVGTPGMWAAFIALVIVAIVVDLLVLRSNGPHKVSAREALLWSLAWVALAAVFNLGLWWYLAEHLPAAAADRVALEFLTGYLVEKALAVDNIFVFLMLFSYFKVRPEFQQRALILGVIGAILLRAIMILIGAALIARFHWILYVFGLFLMITGAKMLWAAGDESDVKENPILGFINRHLPLTREMDGEKLWIVENGKRLFTPMFVVLLMIGITDVIFAVDSIPAIFAITTDPFIVLTSNVFAVLGLRALYFLLADMKERFHLLAYGLALVLMFIGAKMLLMDYYKIPIAISLAVVAATIITSMVTSLLVPPKHLRVRS